MQSDRLFFMVSVEVVVTLLMFLILFLVLDLPSIDVYHRADFFQVRDEYFIFGECFSAPSFRVFLIVFFLVNSIIATISSNFLSAITHAVKDAPDIIDRRMVFWFTFVYDILLVAKNLFALLGILGSITFFASAATGQVIGAFISRYILVYHSEIFKLGYNIRFLGRNKRERAASTTGQFLTTPLLASASSSPLQATTKGPSKRVKRRLVTATANT